MRILVDRARNGVATGCAALLLANLSSVGSAVAETSAVVVDRSEETCPSAFNRLLIDELRLRTTAELLDGDAAAADTSGWRVVLRARDAKKCEVRLQDGDGATTFVIANDAGRVAIASVATRLAWIIDGSPDSAEVETTPDPEPKPEPPRAAEEATAPAGGESASVDIADETSPGATNARATHFALDAMGGALWIPSAGAGLALVRVGARWKPWSRLEIGVAGRLPPGTAKATVVGTDYSYRPWSVDLTAAYAHPVPRRWSLSFGLGSRRTFSQLTVTENEAPGAADEVLEGTPARVTGEPDSAAQNALSPWAVVGNTGVSHSLSRSFALRFDATGAMSLADRKVRDGQRVVIDLGRFEFDASLGLELRF